MKSKYYWNHIEEERRKGRERYAMLPNDCGIYKIINRVNGKYYVGSSWNLDIRWKRHSVALRGNRHFNNHLQRAWNKYGQNAFEFIVIERCSEDDLLNVEQRYLDIAKTELDNIYNMNFDARRLVLRGKDNPHFGKHHTKKAKKAIGDKQRGMKRITADKTVYHFQHIETSIIFYGTRCEFREKYRMDMANICRLIQGKRKTCKGWIIV